MRALLASVGVAGLFAVSTLLLGRRGFGLGDAKLALSCAASAGLGGVAHGGGRADGGVLRRPGVVSGALLVARRVRWSTHLPFGPFLVLGTLAGLMLAAT